MTPRSRKPVMVLATITHNSSEQNQTICPTDYASFREQDEDESSHSRNSADFTQTEIDAIDVTAHLQCENATSLDSYIELMRARQSVSTAPKNGERSVEKVDALSNNFK